MKSQAGRAKPRGRSNARSKILDAALKTISDVGLADLTLDAVAERAGVTKGGLLYHFPFKEDLLAATSEHLVSRLVAAREAAAAHLPDGPSRRIKAYVLASVSNRFGNDSIGRRLLAGGAMSEAQVAPIRRYFHERYAPFASDVGADRAALVHAATEGLWFMEVLGLSPFSSAERARLVTILLGIADGELRLDAAAERGEPGPVETVNQIGSQPASRSGDELAKRRSKRHG